MYVVYVWDDGYLGYECYPSYEECQCCYNGYHEVSEYDDLGTCDECSSKTYYGECSVCGGGIYFCRYECEYNGTSFENGRVYYDSSEGCNYCGGESIVKPCVHGYYESHTYMYDCTQCTIVDGNTGIHYEWRNCEHEQSSAHRYCSHYTTTTLTSHPYCSHGYTSQHL